MCPVHPLISQWSCSGAARAPFLPGVWGTAGDVLPPALGRMEHVQRKAAHEAELPQMCTLILIASTGNNNKDFCPHSKAYSIL